MNMRKKEWNVPVNMEASGMWLSQPQIRDDMDIVGWSKYFSCLLNDAIQIKAVMQMKSDNSEHFSLQQINICRVIIIVFIMNDLSYDPVFNRVLEMFYSLFIAKMHTSG